MSKSRAKGTACESAIVRYLQAHGFPNASRLPLAGSRDVGDVGNIPGVVIEAKHCKRDGLPGWIDEAEREAANAHAPVGVVWSKRVGTTDPGRWIVSMTGATFARLIADDQPGGAA